MDESLWVVVSPYNIKRVVLRRCVISLMIIVSGGNELCPEMEKELNLRRPGWQCWMHRRVSTVVEHYFCINGTFAGTYFSISAVLMFVFCVLHLVGHKCKIPRKFIPLFNSFGRS